MNMIYQIIALALVMAVVWYLGYRRGKTIKEREYAEMEEPSLEPTFNKTKLENEKENRDYLEFCKLFDKLMTDDDFFTGDIAKSSRTDTSKDEIK